MIRLLGRLVVFSSLLTLAACGETKSVEIAAVLPLSGENAIYGLQVKNGIELAFDRLSQRDDFPYAMELKVSDSQSDPDKARDQVDQAYSAGALAAIGGVTSAEALAMVNVADQRDRLLLSPSASSPQLTSISRNFFRVFPSDFLEGSRMGNFATQTLGLKTVVILAAESVYGRGIQEVFKSEFERFGGKVLDVIEYPENTVDFSGVMDRVMTLNPEAVYLADFAGPIASMVEALKDRQFKGDLLTTSAFDAPEILAQVGSKGEGILLTKPVFDLDSEEPQVQEFVAAYSERYGEAPGLYAAHGYDAVLVLAAALERGSRPTASELWKGIRGVRDLPGVTGQISFDEKGDVQKFPRIYILRDGALIDHDRYVAERRDQLRERMEQLRREQQRMRNPG